MAKGEKCREKEAGHREVERQEEGDGTLHPECGIWGECAGPETGKDSQVPSDGEGEGLGLEPGPSRLQAAGAGTQRCQQRAECARSVCQYCAGLCAPEICLPNSPAAAAPAPQISAEGGPGPTLGAQGLPGCARTRGQGRLREATYPLIHRPGYRHTKTWRNTRSHKATRKQNPKNSEPCKHTESFRNSKIHSDAQR